MPETAKLRIAFLLDHLESDYHVDVASGVLRAARSARARTLMVPGGWLARSESEPIARNFIYDLLPLAKLDGVLMLAGGLSNYAGLTRFREWMKRFGKIPVVALGIDVPGVPNVRVDNAAGIQAMMSHLVEVHHHRRIAFIRGPEASPEAEARRRAYLDALEDHGIPADERLVVPGGFGREDGMAAVTELFDRRHFTPATLNAILAVNDGAALGALEELTRRGVTVPDSVAVVGFDDAESAGAANPPLTTVSQRVELQAFTAARALLDAIHLGKTPESVTLDPELVVRASCGCVTRLHNDTSEARPPSTAMARSAALAVVERRMTITAAMARAAAGRLAGMSGWESRLVDALVQDLGAPAHLSFVHEVESFGRRNVAQGRNVAVCHDVVTALRLQAVACTAVEPAARPRIEDWFQEARLRLAKVGADVERERQRNLSLHVRIITRTCLSLVAGDAPGGLATALDEHLPPLGIKAFSLTRLRGSGTASVLELVARHVPNSLADAALTLPLRDLGLDPLLEQEDTLVLEPLSFAGTPVGIAAFAWGAHDPMHYEQLREVLSVAVHSLPKPQSTG